MTFVACLAGTLMTRLPYSTSVGMTNSQDFLLQQLPHLVRFQEAQSTVLMHLGSRLWTGLLLGSLPHAGAWTPAAVCKHQSLAFWRLHWCCSALHLSSAGPAHSSRWAFHQPSFEKRQKMPYSSGQRLSVVQSRLLWHTGGWE